MLKGKDAIKCKTCGAIFYDYKSNHRKYCSMSCRNVMWSKIIKNDHPKHWLGKHRSEETKQKIRMNSDQLGKKGEKHPAWRGNNTKYVGLHSRVYRARGTKKICEICKTSDKNKTYEWANLTGNYKDIYDYKRMCKKCHKKYDSKKRK